MSKLPILLLLVLSLAASATSQIRKVGNGYLFRQKFVKGRSYAYTFTVDMSTPTSTKPVALKGPLKMRILSVSGATAKVQASIGPFSIGQNVASGGQAQTSTVEMTNTGRIIGGGDKIQEMAVAFPEGPKRPGQTWNGSTKLDLYGAPESVASHYKFVGMTTAGGRSAAHLAISLAGTGETGVTGNGDIYLLAEDGSIWKSTSRFIIQMQQMKMKGTMKMVRH